MDVCATGLLHHTTSRHAAEAGTQMTCPPPQPTKPTPTHHQKKTAGAVPLLFLHRWVTKAGGAGGEGHQICSLPVAYYGTSRIMYKVIWDPTWVPSIYSRKGGSAIPARASAPVVHRCCIVASSLFSQFHLFRACACSACLCLPSPRTRPHPAAPWAPQQAHHRAAQGAEWNSSLGSGNHSCTRSLTAEAGRRRKASVLVT
jgi:hypothetical protein